MRYAVAGLGRLGDTVPAELEALRQVAHHAGLIRAEREIEALSTVVDRWTRRDPLFRPDAWLSGLSRVFSLLVAARRVEGASEEIVRAVLGEVRRTYHPVKGALVVTALGAHGWVTDSGFVGVTVALSAETLVILVSNTRPTLAMTSPQGLWNLPLSEGTGLSPADLATGAWRLENARVSDDGRLSMAAGLVVTRLPPPGLSAWEPYRVAVWTDLVDRLTGPPDPLASSAAVFVLLEPTDVSEPVSDEVRNQVVVRLCDSVGAEVRVVVTVRPETAILRENLAWVAANPHRRPIGWFGRCDVDAHGIRLDVWTLLFDGAVRTRRGLANVVHVTMETLSAGRL